MRLSRCEQEVVINFNAEETTMSIYTADPVWIRKLDRLVESNSREYSFVRQETYKGRVVSKTYLAPKKLLTLRSKTQKRELTEEQKKEIAERLKRR
jgi:hypothetical protein